MFDDFIKGLNLNISINPVTPDEIERVSQLSVRTNQFNMSTKRRDVNELNILLKQGYHCYIVNVADRFGDYGLVGVVILRMEDELIVDTFLLSCRVLGRGIEHKNSFIFG